MASENTRIQLAIGSSVYGEALLSPDKPWYLKLAI